MSPQVFHVTPLANLPSILRLGLQPRIGPRSDPAGEPIAAIYAFPSRSALEDALTNWMADAFEDDVELAILTVRVPKETRTGVGAGFETVLLDPIAPENILRIEDERGKILSRESLGLASSFDAAPEEIGRNPRFGSAGPC